MFLLFIHKEIGLHRLICRTNILVITANMRLCELKTYLIMWVCTSRGMRLVIEERVLEVCIGSCRSEFAL